MSQITNLDQDDSSWIWKPPGPQHSSGQGLPQISPATTIRTATATSLSGFLICYLRREGKKKRTKKRNEEKERTQEED